MILTITTQPTITATQKMFSLNPNPLTNLQTLHALAKTGNLARKLMALLPGNILTNPMPPVVV
jgi:hypothetical protein